MRSTFCGNTPQKVERVAADRPDFPTAGLEPPVEADRTVTRIGIRLFRPMAPALPGGILTSQ
jgi:hypothetical protein